MNLLLAPYIGHMYAGQNDHYIVVVIYIHDELVRARGIYCLYTGEWYMKIPHEAAH